jgi:UDP-3-O-[3-hydroxymyristoyl] glucosamine N-acyltransferase
MEFSINQVAAILGGTVQGNGELMVNRLDKIQDATSGAITFLSNLKYENFIYNRKRFCREKFN